MLASHVDAHLQSSTSLHFAGGQGHGGRWDILYVVEVMDIILFVTYSFVMAGFGLSVMCSLEKS